MHEKDLITFVIDSKLPTLNFYTNIKQNGKYINSSLIQSLYYGNDANYREGVIKLNGLRIVPTDELHMLVTKDRYRTKLEIHNRKTLRISYIGSGIALLTALFSIWFSIQRGNETRESNKLLREALEKSNKELISTVKEIEVNPVINVEVLETGESAGTVD